jgi:hypothetical protein
MPNNDILSEKYGIGYKVKENAGRILISGMFRVKEGEEYKRGDNLHAAMVMVVTTPIKGIITFEDDLVYKSGTISGTLDIDFSSVIEHMEDKRFNILLSIGKHLSNIETVILK